MIALLATAILTLTNAHHAVLTYERLYWHGKPVTITVSDCRRRSARQVTCLAEARAPNQRAVAEDWVTLLAHGIMRVHPGRFAIVEVL